MVGDADDEVGAGLERIVVVAAFAVAVDLENVVVGAVIDEIGVGFWDFEVGVEILDVGGGTVVGVGVGELAGVDDAGGAIDVDVSLDGGRQVVVGLFHAGEIAV